MKNNLKVMKNVTMIDDMYFSNNFYPWKINCSLIGSRIYMFLLNDNF